ncbi:Diacylglycerol O-acyltransferase 2 [Chlorella vulgaris]
MESPAPSGSGQASPSLTESPTIVERSPESPARPRHESSDEWEVIQQKTRHRHPSIPQKLAALFYNLSFGGGIYSTLLALWLCTLLPPLTLLLAAYYAWVWLGAGMDAAKSGSYPKPLRRWALWRACAAYFPARLHRTVELPPGKPYIFCTHPHGILSCGSWLAFATEALGFSSLFPGIDCRVLTLSINFRSILFREYLLLHGVCDVSKHTCLALLGAGKSIMIAVGGGTESLFARPGANQLVLRKRKGFIKVALRSGASLVPVYVFGENSTFRTANEQVSGSLLHRFQRRLTKLTGFTVPLFYGTGLVLPWGFLPFPVPLEVVVGEPLEVERFSGDEGSAEFQALVDRLHARYVAALTELFNSYKEKFAKGEADLELVE